RHSRTFRREKENRATSRDEGRWSDEIVCDGRSVMVAKIAIQNDRAPRLSEKVINDGRMRGKVTRVKDNWTHKPSQSSRPPSQRVKGYVRSINRIIESHATSEMPPIQPPSEKALEGPKSPEIPLMIDIDKPVEEMKLICDDLLVDISLDSRSETGIESLVEKCSVNRSGGSSG